MLGEDITTSDAGQMQSIVIGSMSGTVAADLSPEETAQVTAMRRDLTQSMIKQWKVNRALFQQYGGRIIYQQFGPEPLDASRMLLEEKQQEGSFPTAICK